MVIELTKEDIENLRIETIQRIDRIFQDLNSCLGKTIVIQFDYNIVDKEIDVIAEKVNDMLEVVAKDKIKGVWCR